MSYTTIDNPELYMQTKIYSGDNSSSNAITFDGSDNMSPDWVWLKCRSHSGNHFMYDTTRGATKALVPNDTDQEDTSYGYFTSFDSNGFTLGSADNNVNGSGRTYASWSWKKSATAGFDIVAYTGNNTARTISHSLSAVPEMMIIKKRSEATGSNWIVYHTATSSTGDGHMWWDLDNMRSEDTNSWNNTVPTSSVFSVGTRVENNDNSETFIAYLFRSVQGFSKFSKYRGNNQTGMNAPFIYTGFKPSWVCCKKYSDTNHWIIWDAKRSTKNGSNIIDKKLYVNLANAENGADDISFLSNGFKFHTNTGDWNEDQDYLYMAFSESPFTNSNGVPTTGRF